MAVCIECGMEPLGQMNTPFYTVEGQTCCSIHVAPRFARLAKVRITQLETALSTAQSQIAQLQSDMTALQNRVTAIGG